jgi:hypothetical protein
MVGVPEAVPLPPNSLPAADGGPLGQYNAISCPTSTSCVAVGDYLDNVSLLLSNQVVAVDTMAANGSWGPAAEIALPSNADAGSQLGAVLNGVSCASAGNCTAVDSYALSATSEAPLIASETNGVWNVAVELPTLPAGYQTGKKETLELRGVSCSAAATCTASGDFLAATGNDEIFAVSEAGAAWGTPTVLQVPGDEVFNANEQGMASAGISCTGAGSCTLVGSYTLADPASGVVYTETRGAWGAPTELTAGGYPALVTISVSCWSSGDCVVGGFGIATASSDPVGVTISESNGTFGEASRIATPSGANGSSIFGVDCPSAATCELAAEIYHGTGKKARTLPGYATISDGQLSSLVGLPSVAAVDPGANDGETSSVSCATTASCIAVGFLTNTSSILSPTVPFSTSVTPSGATTSPGSAPGARPGCTPSPRRARPPSRGQRRQAPGATRSPATPSRHRRRAAAARRPARRVARSGGSRTARPTPSRSPPRTWTAPRPRPAPTQPWWAPSRTHRPR